MKPPMRVLVVGAILVVAGWLAAPRTLAQGCVAARMDVSVLAGQPGAYQPDGSWQASFEWRNFKSHRHFVGSEEQTHRADEESEVINWINQMTLSVTYQFTPRWSGTFNAPYAIYRRSNPVRDENREVIDRTETRATGLGDIDFRARRWMLDPETHHKGNFQLGFGIKLPTGEYSVHDTRTNYDPVTHTFYYEVRTVDQSIQPGDGGFGFILDIQAFQTIGHTAAFYASVGYLFNPEETNGVPTYRSRESEAIMSVADQYLARLGFAFPVGHSGVALNIGGRLEGVAVEDVFGGSEGFRRPGYAVSVDPSATYTHGKHSVGLSVPVAVYRNRQRSVPDKMEEGRHGDAAFADYNIIAAYAYRF